MSNKSNIGAIKAEAAANPDMVVPTEVKETVTTTPTTKKAKKVNPLEVVPENPLKSTNIVDHLLNGSVICPADVSSDGLKKIFWRDLVESFGCYYTSPLKPSAQIVLVTPKDNSVKFEQALKKGMNCVEYPVAVKDLRESTNEKVVEFLATNEEWQAMLKREEEASLVEAKKIAEKVARAERAAKRAVERAERVKKEASVTEISIKDISVPKDASNVVEKVTPVVSSEQESANETSIEVTD